MNRRASEKYVCFICDFWWLFVVLFFALLLAYLTRSYWLPWFSSSAQIGGLVPSVTVVNVTPERQIVTPEPIESQTVEPDPTLVVSLIAPTSTDVPTIDRSPVGQGDQVRDFSLKTIDGQEISLSDYSGKPVMIVFFASWCPYCQGEADAVQAMYEKYKNKDLVIIGVNKTFDDKKADVQKYVDKYGWTFPVLLDENGSVFAQYGFSGVPSHSFINKENIVKDIRIGQMNISAMENNVSYSGVKRN